VALLTLGSGLAAAATIVVPNGSFETPAVLYVTTVMTPWVKTPMSERIPQMTPTKWDQAAGIFVNTAAGQPDHIANPDGTQISYMFADPDLGIYQDLSSANAKFQAGFAYDLTVALATGYTYPLPDGAVLRLALYWVVTPGGTDALDPTRVVAYQDVVYTEAGFPGYNLKDFTVHVPMVTAADPWAGRFIGVEIVNVTDEVLGGTWGIDNVRLNSTFVPEPGAAVLFAVAMGGWLSRRQAFGLFRK
jgi:hypothetical protein